MSIGDAKTDRERLIGYSHAELATAHLVLKEVFFDMLILDVLNAPNANRPAEGETFRYRP